MERAERDEERYPSSSPGHEHHRSSVEDAGTMPR